MGTLILTLLVFALLTIVGAMVVVPVAAAAIPALLVSALWSAVFSTDFIGTLAWIWGLLTPVAAVVLVHLRLRRRT